MSAPMCLRNFLRFSSVPRLLSTSRCKIRILSSHSVLTHRKQSSLPPRQAHVESDITEDNLEFTIDYAKVRNILQPSPLKNEPWPVEKWTPRSKRCGIIAIKLGMMPMWTKTGERVPVTLLQLQDCNVIDYRPPEETNEKYGHLYVGAKNAAPFHIHDKEYADIFKKACVPIKQRLIKFRVTDNAKIQPGTPLYAAHFRPGMYVDVSAKSIGHGFQGVMKRWGMKGQPASHGQTKTHRKVGATGSQGVARVMKGKRMAGQMGNRLRVELKLKIWRVNTRYNILYVQGTVPGYYTSFVVVKDSKIATNENPPFPTYMPDLEEEIPEDLYDDNIFSFEDNSVTFEEERDK
ncbi:large ribosomal subunit protein uL3m-like [Glandiceps talaboti]